MPGRDAHHERAFRALLRIFPAEFRGDFGRQMADDFRDQRAEAELRGGAASVMRLWLRTALDAVTTAPLQHLDILRRDAVHAIRLFTKRPVSTVTVALSLAIGIGLNTALFAVVNGVLWKSLPFPQSDRLVRVLDVDARTPDRTSALAFGDFASMRGQLHELSRVAAAGFTSHTIVAPGEPEQLTGMNVTEGFFEVLGARPILGRTFSSADYSGFAAVTVAGVGAAANGRVEPARTGAIVISSGLWQRRFLGSADVIGQKVRLADGVTAEIIGVMGPEMSVFRPPLSAPLEWWTPLAPPRPSSPGSRGPQVFDVIGRLTPESSLDRARAELEVLGRATLAMLPESAGRHSYRPVPLLDTIVKGVRAQLMLLFGAMLAVLLVTCVNVIHLFLAGAAGRQAEFATRVALGATRASLVRQMLTESAVLTAAGAACGLLLAMWTLPILVSMAPAGVPRLNEIGLDWSTTAFAASISLAVALLCGLVAAMPITTAKPWRALSMVRSRTTLQGRRLRNALAIGEIAAALVLVVAAMLMVRTMRTLATLDLGFDPRGVIAANLPRPVGAAASSAERLERIHAAETQVIDAVRDLPGVTAVGVGGSPMGMSLGVGGIKLPGSDDSLPVVGLTMVSVGYFEALGARLEAGRFFSSDDHAGAPRVVIVGESAARRFWPATSAVGKTLILPPDNPVQVIGIVANMADDGLQLAGGIYLPYLQSQYVAPGMMLIKTDRDPESLVPAIKTIVRRINPEQPFPGVTPLQSEIDRATAPRRFMLRLIGLFSSLGLVLAVIGVYGVLAGSVAARVSEIGVRMALGARKVDVLRLILGQGAVLVGLGVAVGLPVAVMLRRQMATMVFGIGTLDSVSYVLAASILVVAGMAACAVPAIRASRLDAAVALRTE